MFYDKDQEAQIQALSEIVEETLKDVKQTLQLDRIKYNSRNFVRRDMKNPKRLMDYCMFFFDTEEIAALFVNYLSDREFNKCILYPEILKPRF